MEMMSRLLGWAWTGVEITALVRTSIGLALELGRWLVRGLSLALGLS